METKFAKDIRIFRRNSEFAVIGETYRFARLSIFYLNPPLHHDTEFCSEKSSMSPPYLCTEFEADPIHNQGFFGVIR